MKEIFPLSLQIALFFRSINTTNIFKLAQILNDKYKKYFVNDEGVLQLNNSLLFPDTPIIRLESVELLKKILFILQNNNRADYIFYNYDDNIENCNKIINQIFDITIEKMYDFFVECGFPINRIGAVETFAVEQELDNNIKTVYKSDGYVNTFNINEGYKVNFGNFQVYDNIRVFNNFTNNRLPPKLKNKKLLYIQRDINSGIIEQGIDKFFINIFKKESQSLFQNDNIREIYKRILR